MKIDTNAFVQSLPIMGVGLLGIFIVTIIIIAGIYILKACTSKMGNSDSSDNTNNSSESKNTKKDEKKDTDKESAMDLLKEREKKDFLDEVENNYISHDL
jgi:hypothetical protein